MSNQYQKAIDKFTEINVITYSMNGYPIYEMMLPSSHPNYIHSSYVAFYTEDENKLKEWNEIRNQSDNELSRQFFKDNMDSISSLQELRKSGITEMNQHQLLAYQHLSSPGALKRTLKEGYYGVAHLIQHGELLIFHQTPLNLKGDFNDAENYNELKNRLIKESKSGKIKADCVITGKAFDKIMETLIGVDFYQLNDYQKENLFIINDFIKNIDITLEAGIKLIDDKRYAKVEIEGREIKIQLPSVKKEEFVLSEGDNEITYKKLADILYKLSEEISKEKTKKFIKGSKIK